ncbi:MAG: NAD(P)H-dependent glycerol-3-phosphate dehydrogenase [Acetivibrionales bacterium]|jgi:glycerol-3-phosphate dehydrogenase (NAD(P)+)
MKTQISIMGAGSMGTALSILLSKNGHGIRMWSPFREEVEMINNDREHKHKLPGIRIPGMIKCTDDLEEALWKTEVVVIALPSQTIRENCRNFSRYVNNNSVIVCCSKGIEEDTCMFLSDVIKQEAGEVEVAVLTGPSHAEEIARDIPTTVVAASPKREIAEFVQDIFMTPRFRVYTNPDVIGVELGGAIKNVIALCAGISDGLGFGDNTKAALMTRGIAEISRLGNAMGAQPQTFSGLAGIGDLIVTCTSMHSRNRRAGILIGQGKSAQEAIDEVKMVVEGISTVKPACILAKMHNVVMPITFEAYEILFNGKEPEKAVSELMTRDKKHEMEGLE